MWFLIRVIKLSNLSENILIKTETSDNRPDKVGVAANSVLLNIVTQVPLE